MHWMRVISCALSGRWWLLYRWTHRNHIFFWRTNTKTIRLILSYILCIFWSDISFEDLKQRRRHSWCDDNLTSFVWRRTSKMAFVSLMPGPKHWNWFSCRPPNYYVHIFHTHMPTANPLRIHTRPKEIYKFLVYFHSLAASVCSSMLRIEPMLCEWEQERRMQGWENGCCYTLLSMI